MGFGLLVCVSVSALNPPLPIQNLTDTFNRDLEPLLRQWQVDGASVGIMHDGETKFLSFGKASITTGAPYTSRTISQQGSTSKTLAAWAIMQLVERGVVGLDDPVEKYISWTFPHSTFDSTQVTIRRLLSHTAGIGLHGFSGFVGMLPDTKTSLDAQKNGCCLPQGTWSPGDGDTRIMWKPGTTWQYSGGGYHVLQLLLEEVYKQPFSIVMQEQVLKPLGMSSSGYWGTGGNALISSTGFVAESRCPLDPPLSLGCEVDADWQGRLPNYLFAASSAAGLYSTPEDFARFLQTHINDTALGKVLNRSTLDAMLTPQAYANVSWGTDRKYGLGYELVNVTVGRGQKEHSEPIQSGVDALMVGHSGSNIGWKLEFVVVPQARVGYTLHTNGEAGDNVLQAVRAMFLNWLAGGNSSAHLRAKDFGTEAIGRKFSG